MALKGVGLGEKDKWKVAKLLLSDWKSFSHSDSKKWMINVQIWEAFDPKSDTSGWNSGKILYFEYQSFWSFSRQFVKKPAWFIFVHIFCVNPVRISELKKIEK